MTGVSDTGHARCSGMRWLCLIVLLVGCGSKYPGVQRHELGVEDTAMWFMRAALAGDQATARTMTLHWYELAQFTAPPHDAAKSKEFEAALEDVLSRLEREGQEKEAEVMSVKVIDRRKLTPGKDSKVTKPVEIAIVQYEVKEPSGRRHTSPLPWFFVKTEDGWKFTPKK